MTPSTHSAVVERNLREALAKAEARISSLERALERALQEAQEETNYQAERANRNDHEREAMRRERDEVRAGWEHAASRAEYAEAQLDQAQALLRDADPNDIEWIEAKQAFLSTPNPTEGTEDE